MSDLTARQIQHARLYCLGYSSHEAAQALNITQDSARAALRDIRVLWTGGGMSRKDFYARCVEEGII